ncbi:hypothetical protein [Haloplanus halobius]|uniref:DUF7847 domain-containing protein n=1 Tax=Haloplanus halobius TaxID=2934938 RepID=UPI0020104813|nr:hypothetical protein [Haloplanus sp. XH21]
MSAIQSLRTAIDALSRNTVLLVGGLVYALVLLPQRALQLAGVPLAPTLLQLLTFFVTPFVLAGVIGMAREALDGDASLDSLTRVGKTRYVDLLLGTLVEFAIQLVFGIGIVILALVVALGGAAAGTAGPAVLVGIALIALLTLGYLIVLFAIQFYPVAIVADDVGPVDGITESVGFVRSNVLSTLGYTLVTVVLGGLASLPVTGFVAYRSVTSGLGSMDGEPPVGGGGNAPPPETLDALAGGLSLGLSTPEIVVLSLVSLVTTALFFAFRQTYATAFYERNGRTVEERVLGEDL